jgi:hypothetical protein
MFGAGFFKKIVNALSSPPKPATPLPSFSEKSRKDGLFLQQPPRGRQHHNALIDAVVPDREARTWPTLGYEVGFKATM